jgi:hypothetical protein
MIEFFNQRTQGRPIVQSGSGVSNAIKLLEQKVKLHK